MSRLGRYFFPIAFFVTLAGVVWLWVNPRQTAKSLAGALNYQRETALVKAVERVAPSVVSIAAVKKKSVQYSRVEDLLRRRMLGPLSQDQLQTTEIGSGIILDEDGYILTNDHLVGRSEQVWVTTSNGEEFEAKVVGTDARFDLAVIRVENANKTFSAAPLGNSNELLVGEWVVALGNPYGQLLVNPEPSVTAGVVSALNRNIEDNRSTAVYKNMIQTDATINPGNSGGPLVNAAGEVVGINTFAFQQSGVSLGLGFAIPINTALELAQDLIRYGHVRGAWVGIAVFALSELPKHSLQALGFENETNMDGVVVWTLERGSPAVRAGIKLGDLIRAVNGERVTNSRAAQRAIFGARVGDTITFLIERSGEQFEISVTLEAPPNERSQEVSP